MSITPRPLMSDIADQNRPLNLQRHAEGCACSGCVAWRDRAYDIEELAELEAKVQHEQRTSPRVETVKPRNPYGDLDSPHSYVCDALSVLGSDGFAVRERTDSGAEERLQRHAAVVADKAKYDRAIRSQLRERYRSADERQTRSAVDRDLGAFRRSPMAASELRGLVTGGGMTATASGGAAAFVTPLVLLDLFAAFRSPTAGFLHCLNTDTPLPDYGLEAYVPAITAGATISTTTEGAATSEGDPTFGLTSAPIVDKSGQITVSQATLDRVGPGMRGDAVLWTQLAQQLQAAIDAYAISQALASPQTVTNSGTFALTSASGVGGMAKDVKTAKNLIHDQAGVRLRASHAFASGDVWDYVTAWADAEGRPVFSPIATDYGADPSGDQGDDGCVGYNVWGLRAHADDNIPNVSNNAQVIVCRPSTIVQMTGAPIFDLVPQYGAGTLDPVVRCRQYAATVARFQSGVAQITGAAYSASQFA